MHKEGIAIVGIGCRFPGGINDTESLWKLLLEAREALSEIPPDRWNLERFYDPEPMELTSSIRSSLEFRRARLPTWTLSTGSF